MFYCRNEELSTLNKRYAAKAPEYDSFDSALDEIPHLAGKDGKGIYYEEKVCEMNAVCKNDDELTLCLVKELGIKKM